MSRVQVIQDIIDTGVVQWGASKEEAKVILGGDQPWTRRVIGVSTCPEVGSMFNEGIWNAQTKTWEGSANPRTTRPSSLGRHPCKPPAAVRGAF